MTTNCCRSCQTLLEHSFVDLGMSPFSNSYVKLEKANLGETTYPLHVFVCHECFLVQLAEFEDPSNIFSHEYAYFSSFSSSWLEHAKKYTEAMIKRFVLDKDAHIAEVASNDGYLLQYFHEKNMKVTGIEPAANCAAVATEKAFTQKYVSLAKKHPKRSRKKEDKPI